MALSIALYETGAEIRVVMTSHGWSPDGLDIVELSEAEPLFSPESQPTIFRPAEVELTETTLGLRDEVERIRPERLVFDSLNGYLHAVPGERWLEVRMHQVLSYPGQQGVASILVAVQHGLLGTLMAPQLNLSYLADTVILLRYHEFRGEVRQAISVVKRRAGGHERTIRDLRFGPEGIRLSEPLREFRGVLTGTPQCHDGAGDRRGE